MIKQWGIITTQATDSDVNFLLSYTSKDSFVIMSTPTTQSSEDTYVFEARIYIKSNNSVRITWYTNGSGSRNKQWSTIGY